MQTHPLPSLTVVAYQQAPSDHTIKTFETSKAIKFTFVSFCCFPDVFIQSRVSERRACNEPRALCAVCYLLFSYKIKTKFATFKICLCASRALSGVLSQFWASERHAYHSVRVSVCVIYRSSRVIKLFCWYFETFN